MAGSAPKLLVCADDLTGANDIGVQFARRGISSIVFIEPEQTALPEGFEVVVVNTVTRHLSPARAAERVRRIVELGLRAGIEAFYKKTDSTLRGNVGAELEALARAAGARVLPFIPAFPQLGRTTRNGIHYVNGQPLHEGAFGRDPLNPARTSSVKEILEAQCRLRIQLAGESSDFEKAEGILVFDAEKAEDLSRIAAELDRRGMPRVIAGPAGFGIQLAKRLPFERGTAPVVPPCAPMLLVNGSLNERSLEQIERAPDAVRISLAPRDLLGPRPAMSAEQKARVEAAWTAGQNVIARTISNREELAEWERAGAEAGIRERELHLRVAEAIGEALREILPGFGSLAVFGGDTLLGIARACGWSAFIPLGEPADGISVSRPVPAGPIVVSKAGGFGDLDTVRRIFEFVARGSN